METVLILMSTYNGEKYIKEQIESLLYQEGVNVKILVRDDGSSDATLEILQEYKEKGVLDYYTGENLRSAGSFMNLIYNAPEYEYYALCDQDDVWIQGKLKKAVESLEGLEGAGLYYHAMNLVDENLEKFGYYFRSTDKTTSLEYTCLYGGEIAGCTMVFNRQLLEALRKYKPELKIMHDGWIHRVCLCVNGVVIGDETAYINYRQHRNNVVGMKKRSLKKQLSIMLSKQRKFSRTAADMLEGYSEFMNDDSVDFLRSLSMQTGSGKKIRALGRGLKVKASSREKIKYALKVMYGSY